jgi:hypothetical protein
VQRPVDRTQGSLQFADGLTLEGGQQRAETLEGDPGALGLAVSGSPAQALDLGDDLCLRPRLIRLIGGQAWLVSAATGSR